METTNQNFGEVYPIAFPLQGENVRRAFNFKQGNLGGMQVGMEYEELNTPIKQIEGSLAKRRRQENQRIEPMGNSQEDRLENENNIPPILQESKKEFDLVLLLKDTEDLRQTIYQ